MQLEPVPNESRVQQRRLAGRVSSRGKPPGSKIACSKNITFRSQIKKAQRLTTKTSCSTREPRLYVCGGMCSLFVVYFQEYSPYVRRESVLFFRDVFSNRPSDGVDVIISRQC